jgi:hypothetical protein
VRQARGQKSKRGFYLALLLVGIAGVAGILWATQRSGESNVVTLPTTPSVTTNAPGYVRGSPTARSRSWSTPTSSARPAASSPR